MSPIRSARISADIHCAFATASNWPDCSMPPIFPADDRAMIGEQELQRRWAALQQRGTQKL